MIRFEIINLLIIFVLLSFFEAPTVLITMKNYFGVNECANAHLKRRRHSPHHFLFFLISNGYNVQLRREIALKLVTVRSMHSDHIYKSLILYNFYRVLDKGFFSFVYKQNGGRITLSSIKRRLGFGRKSRNSNWVKPWKRGTGGNTYTDAEPTGRRTSLNLSPDRPGERSYHSTLSREQRDWSGQTDLSDGNTHFELKGKRTALETVTFSTGARETPIPASAPGSQVSCHKFTCFFLITPLSLQKPRSNEIQCFAETFAAVGRAKYQNFVQMLFSNVCKR